MGRMAAKVEVVRKSLDPGSCRFDSGLGHQSMESSPSGRMRCATAWPPGGPGCKLQRWPSNRPGAASRKRTSIMVTGKWSWPYLHQTCADGVEPHDSMPLELEELELPRESGRLT